MVFRDRKQKITKYTARISWATPILFYTACGVVTFIPEGCSLSVPVGTDCIGCIKSVKLPLSAQQWYTDRLRSVPLSYFTHKPWSFLLFNAFTTQFFPHMINTHMELITVRENLNIMVKFITDCNLSFIALKSTVPLIILCNDDTGNIWISGATVTIKKLRRRTVTFVQSHSKIHFRFNRLTWQLY